ncbi:MAG: hypothetical protein J5765_02045 [Clostridia bacterium]|nr:hypothetical protein [Clostridia bacterium]
MGLLVGVVAGVVIATIIKKIGNVAEDSKEEAFKKEEWTEKEPQKDSWLNENVYKSPDFISYEKEKRAKYNALIDQNITVVESSRKELTDIHNEMKEVIPLPDRYRDEYHVKCLLALVTDRRADTLKEAINLLETENYRSNVLGSLQQLNSHLLALGNSIASLGNMVYQGFSGVMKQNAIINSRITSLQYQQQAMFTAAMLFR